ncbi:MAG: TIGR00730 family Rossman fold protein, partial [Candidatus Pacebacteria bacterium]|nr:TIGR00730 family Rossman fold protein [Candidatus Paceibacterota bacterium]
PQAKMEPFKPLTLEEIHEATEKRIEKIQEEFTEGFRTIEKHPKSVTFFGSARLSENHPSYKDAYKLAEMIVKDLGYSVVTGGGPGIMEAANRGAHENAGKSVGLQINLPGNYPYEHNKNKFVTDSVNFYYFFSRKVCLSFSAESYVFFPGGFGTLDELFEILTLVQTGKIEPVPIILVGKSYWKYFDLFTRKILLKNRLIDESDSKLYTITDSLDEAIQIIKEAPIRNGIRFDPNK